MHHRSKGEQLVLLPIYAPLTSYAIAEVARSANTDSLVTARQLMSDIRQHAEGGSYITKSYASVCSVKP